MSQKLVKQQANKMFPRFVFYISIFFVSLWGFYKFGVGYAYSDLKDYVNILMSVSSMVFTIMGIWIAFLYPNALQRLVSPDKVENADFSETLGETKRLEGLVGSVLKSAFVLSMILSFFMAKLIVSGLDFYDELIFDLKNLSLSFFLVLSVLQLESVFYVVYSNVMFVNELHQKREDREADADV